MLLFHLLIFIFKHNAVCKSPNFPALAFNLLRHGSS